MVLGGDFALAPAYESSYATSNTTASTPALNTPKIRQDQQQNAILSYSGQASFGEHLACLGFSETIATQSKAYFGASFAGNFAGNFLEQSSAAGTVWQHSRLLCPAHVKVQISGAHTQIGVSDGLHALGQAQRIEQSHGFVLDRLGGQDALSSLNQALNAFFCTSQKQHNLHLLHWPHLAALLLENAEGEEAASAIARGAYRPLALVASQSKPDQPAQSAHLLSANSLLFSEALHAGQSLCWAIRQSATSEANMRHMLAQQQAQHVNAALCSPNIPACPSAALMFSCLGRGANFYGGEDRDLLALREFYPNLPILGVYGTGQLASVQNEAAKPHTFRLREWQNAVVNALIFKAKETHV